jgi:hypothetical protein
VAAAAAINAAPAKPKAMGDTPRDLRAGALRSILRESSSEDLSL